MLEDFVTLTQQLPHLEVARTYLDIPALLEAIKQRHWPEAEKTLREMLTRGMALTAYESPENAELRLSLRTLEAQIIAFATEQIETEQLIEQFSKRQNSVIGDILGQYLELRKRVFARKAKKTGKTVDTKAYEEAKEESEKYQQSHDTTKEISPLDKLNDEQQAELKLLFRQACMLCHPDRVGEDDKAQAQASFTQVHQAYKNADLATLHRLYKNLKEGKPFEDLSEIPNEVDHLRRQVARLWLEVERYTAAIYQLRQTETYQTLSAHADWDIHFAEARQQLEIECEKLLAELSEEL